MQPNRSSASPWAGVIDAAFFVVVAVLVLLAMLLG